MEVSSDGAAEEITALTIVCGTSDGGRGHGTRATEQELRNRSYGTGAAEEESHMGGGGRVRRDGWEGSECLGSRNDDE